MTGIVLAVVILLAVLSGCATASPDQQDAQCWISNTRTGLPWTYPPGFRAQCFHVLQQLAAARANRAGLSPAEYRAQLLAILTSPDAVAVMQASGSGSALEALRNRIQAEQDASRETAPGATQ